MNAIRIMDTQRLQTIGLPPGELVKARCFDVAAILASRETVEAVTADDASVVPAASGESQYLYLDLVGPANGEQKPVRVTVTGDRGSVRHISLLVEGLDPLTKLIPAAPRRYLLWQGEWSADSDYAPMDLAVYDGGVEGNRLIYLALGASKNHPPDLYPALWFPWAGVGVGGGAGPGGPVTALRGVVNGDTYELTLGTDEFGGVTTIITNLTGGES